MWRWARRLWGARGALVALGFYAFAPEALAHAGVVTMDVPTALGFVTALMSWQAFVIGGRWRAWTAAALSVAYTFLVRFTAVFLPPLLLALTLEPFLRRRVRAPRRVWLGYALLAVTTVAALQIGYLGRTSWQPLGRWRFESHAFQSLARRAPGLVLPLPDTYISGFDRQAVESEPHATPSYLMGVLHADAPLAYFPVALAVKCASPIPAVTASAGWRMCTALPSTRTSPERIGRSPASARASSERPAPTRPARATTSPALTWRLTE